MIALLGQYPDVTKKPQGQARRSYNIQKAAGIDPAVYKVMKVDPVIWMSPPRDLLKPLKECHETSVPQTPRHRFVPYISAADPNG